MAETVRLSEAQRRFLSRRVCWLCELPLNRDGCGSVYGGACTQEIRDKRRADCLATYKPRRGRSSLSGNRQGPGAATSSSARD